MLKITRKNIIKCAKRFFEIYVIKRIYKYNFIKHDTFNKLFVILKM